MDKTHRRECFFVISWIKNFGDLGGFTTFEMPSLQDGSCVVKWKTEIGTEKLQYVASKSLNLNVVRR